MQAVVIAAGESSRFWPLNGQHKAASYLLGKPVLYWTIKGLVDNNVKDIVVVCSANSQIPQILEKENDLGVSLRFVFQQQPLGTGNALWQAKEYIKEEFFVVWPNKVNSKDIAQQVLLKRKAGFQTVLVGAKTLTPWDYGIARFQGEQIVEIQENPEQGKEPSQIKVIGFYFFESDFFQYYEKMPSHHEADFIEAINIYLKHKKGTLVELEKDVPALKYPWELFGILDILLNSDTFKPRIDPGCVIGKNVSISGEVFIGANAVIKDHTVIQGPCFIGENTEIGYANVIKGATDIAKDVKTGAFCEIKHSIVQEGAHFHSGYVGNSLIGKNCRIGAGFISANRRLDRGPIIAEVKGKKVDTHTTSLGVAIGEETRIGIHAGTMPGILIGKNCTIGPGVQIMKNLPDESKLFLNP